MRGLLLCAVCTLLLLGAREACAQTPQVLRIGRTYSATGFSSSEARPITNGINFWYQWMKNNSNGGIWNKGVFYEIELIQFDDASSTQNVAFMYRGMHELYNLTAAFGPWTMELTQQILPYLKEANIPIVVSGAAGGALYTGAFTNMVGMLVNGAKRSLPCFELFSSKNVKTAAVLRNSDAFMTFVASQYLLQLNALNISVVYQANFSKGETDFTEVVANIAALKPDIVAVAQQENDLRPMLQQLRGTIPLKNSPKAIMSANTNTAQVAYETIGWPADSLYGGDQWSPEFLFADEFFNSTTNFAHIYINWLRGQGVQDEINFWDAASVAAGFVMKWALENTPTFEPEDLIATLRSVNLTETFFGPISFLPTGELNSRGICQQLMPSPDPTAPLSATTERAVQAVWPLDIASAAARFPGLYVKPPSPGISQSRKYLIGFLTAGLVLLVLFTVAIVIFLKYRYHWVFIPRDDAKDEWSTN